MTREDILEKRRQEFEIWCEREGYNPNAYLALESWNAALDSVVIELPYVNSVAEKLKKHNRVAVFFTLLEVSEKINDQGFRTK